LRDSASFESSSVKIRPGVSSLRLSEKKKLNEQIKSQESYISPVCPEGKQFVTKFGTNVPLIDILTNGVLI